MNPTPKKMAAVVAGSAVLASAAYGVGTQAGDGNATAAGGSSSSSSHSSFAARPGGPGDRGLSGFAQQLGVSEAKLRAALHDLRPRRAGKRNRRGEMSAALAKELGVSEAKVQAILDDLRPGGARRPGRARFARALANELGISTAKVRAALADAKDDRRGPPALDDLATRLGVSEAKLRSALEDIRPKPFQRRGGGDRMRAKLVAALAKGLNKDASEVRAALRKVHAARRDEFASKLADKLGISVEKVKAALPEGGPGHHGPRGPGGPGGPGGHGGPPPGGGFAVPPPGP